MSYRSRVWRICTYCTYFSQGSWNNVGVPLIFESLLSEYEDYGHFQLESSYFSLHVHDFISSLIIQLTEVVCVIQNGITKLALLNYLVMSWGVCHFFINGWYIDLCHRSACLIFAVDLEKYDFICCGDKNSPTANRRSPFSFLARRISLATWDGSSL